MSLLDKLKDMGSATEDDSERDGFLSYSKETHAVGEGFYAGFTTSPFHDPKVPDEYSAEDHYWKGGYVAGTLTQAVFLLAASYGIIQLP